MDRIILILLAFFIGICLYYLVNDRCRCVNGVTGYNEVKGVNKVTGYKEGFSVGIARSKNEEDLNICDSSCINCITLSKIIKGSGTITIICDGEGKFKFSDGKQGDVKEINSVYHDPKQMKPSGDIRSLSELENLEIINLYNTNVSGDIRSLSELPNLQQIGLTGTKVSGDISSLSKLENLEYIYLADTNVSGDIKSLKDSKHLTELDLSGNPEITGDINDFLTHSSNITNMTIHDTKIRGDITELAEKVYDNTYADFAELGFSEMFGVYGIQNTNIYGDISKMAEMLLAKGIKSIKIVGLDKTCVFYTGGNAKDIVDLPHSFWSRRRPADPRRASWIYISYGDRSDYYKVNKFPTEIGGDSYKNKDCWSCSMTQSVIEDKYNDLNTLKKFYSTQHTKKHTGKPSNKKCPILVYPMCNPKMDQLCPGNNKCPDCGEDSCYCPPHINSNSNSENSLFN